MTIPTHSPMRFQMRRAFCLFFHRDGNPIVHLTHTNVDNSAVKIGIPVEMVTRKMRNERDERGLIVREYK